MLRIHQYRSFHGNQIDDKTVIVIKTIKIKLFHQHYVSEGIWDNAVVAVPPVVAMCFANNEQFALEIIHQLHKPYYSANPAIASIPIPECLCCYAKRCVNVCDASTPESTTLNRTFYG